MEIKPVDTPEESKLLILYLFNEIDYELNDLQVLRVFVDLDMMNYFDMMNYLGELTSGDMLSEKELPTGKVLSITPKGRNILSEFKEEIRHSYRVRISEYCAEHKSEIQAEAQFIGDYYRLDQNEYRVILKILDPHVTVFEMDIKVFSKDDAMHAISNWRKNAPRIYKTVFELLK